MTLNPAGYALLGLTALVACLASVLTFAVLRFAAAAKDARRNIHGTGSETALLSAALQDAVTKLKAQERATAARAEASERLSGEIIASLTAGLLVTGKEGDLQILNPAGRRMLRLPEAIEPRAYTRSARERPLFDVIDECLRTGIPAVRRAVTIGGTGEPEAHLGVSVSLLNDHDGRRQGAICLFTDLTAVHDLEEQLRLKDSLATVGELTAGIAHEFRNGLATIHGYSKLFDLGALPESYRPYVEGIRAETESLSQVVTNFLTFARPETLTLARVDIGALCERAAEDVRNDARAAGGEVEVWGEFGEVDGDEILLRQAISNLLRNALEACAGGATSPRIIVQGEIDRAQKVLRLSVNDNGSGIDPAVRDRVFRPFVTTKRSGTGLGLALVQKIVVFHNGRVAAGASSIGGASLQVTLPLAG